MNIVYLCRRKRRRCSRSANQTSLLALGDYWLLYQQSKPHLVVHVQLPKSESEFDNILGWCLGQNKWCDYIEGNLSFICVAAGFNAAELTPKYPDFIKERVYALYDAVYWWNEYGFEWLLKK